MLQTYAQNFDDRPEAGCPQKIFGNLLRPKLRVPQNLQDLEIVVKVENLDNTLTF